MLLLLNTLRCKHFRLPFATYVETWLIKKSSLLLTYRNNKFDVTLLCALLEASILLFLKAS